MLLEMFVCTKKLWFAQHGSQVVVVVVGAAVVVVVVPHPVITVSHVACPSYPGSAHAHGAQLFVTTSQAEPFHLCLQVEQGAGVVVEVVVGTEVVVVVVKQLKHGNNVVVVPPGAGVVVVGGEAQ